MIKPSKSSKIKVTGLIAQLKDKARALPSQYAIIREKMQDLAKTNTDLGFAHLERGNLSDAVMRFKMVLRWFGPDHAPAVFGLACCRKEEGDYLETAQLLRRAIELKSGNYPEAEYLLAQVDDTVIPNSIPIEFVRSYFDELAPVFNEEFLGNRHYRGPEMLLDVAATALKDKKDLTVVDIGCGTGLCGKEFKENKLAAEVTGVDFSKEMLKQAQSLKHNYRPVYDTIVEQDYIAYFDNPNAAKKFDVALAALAFHHQRDLAKVLGACKKILKPGGVIVFTACKSSGKEVEFLPEHHAYAFSLAYLEAQAQKAGLTSVVVKEGGIYEGCQGYACAFVNNT